MNKIEHSNHPKETLVPKEGQFYYIPIHDRTYLLARVAPDKFSLVSVSSGDRWTVSPEDSTLNAFNGLFNDFVLVSLPFTITPNIQ